MHACIILHNMIIEDECGWSYNVDGYKIVETFTEASTSSPEALKGFAAILQHEAAMHANLVHDQLQNSSMKHI
jgi:hypothetical protein